MMTGSAPQVASHSCLLPLLKLSFAFCTAVVTSLLSGAAVAAAAGNTLHARAAARAKIATRIWFLRAHWSQDGRLGTIFRMDGNRTVPYRTSVGGARHAWISGTGRAATGLSVPCIPAVLRGRRRRPA